MQRHFLGRGIAGDEPAVGGKPRQPRRIQRAERRIGRRHQPAAVIKSDADIARRARRQPALEQRAAEAADFLAYPGFGHGSILFAALSHALAARPSRDTEGQSREETKGTPHARIRHPKTARRRHRAGLDGFRHGDLAAARGF